MKINKKQLIQAIICFLVVLAVYHLIAFVIPFPHTGAFWAGYVFGIIAILILPLVLYFAYRSAPKPRDKFYATPVARNGVIYFLVQMLVSFLAMALGFLFEVPTWIIIACSALLLAGVIMFVIASDTVRNEVIRQEDTLAAKTATMRQMQSQGRVLLSQCNDQKLAAQLHLLADELRYSDPVGSGATAQVEQELEQLLQEMQNGLNNRDYDSVLHACANARKLLAERNQICLLNK